MSALIASAANPAITPDATASAALSPGDFAELLAAFNDVTGRLQRTHETLRAEVARLESELRDSREQLRRARHLAALGEMAAGIAHEVRNPLGSVRLYAKILREDLGDRPAQREVAEKIEAAVRRLDAVVGDVLQFARERPPRMQRVRPADVMREAAEACGEVLSRFGVRVEVEDACGGEVLADPGMLRQALVNLVRNAAEAMGEAGTPMEERRLTMGVRRSKPLNADGRREAMVSLAVRDRGPGVPPDLAEKLFDPFITTRHEGTGLGLAIVHRIVDAHGGRVSLRNNPAGEGGATAEILIPEMASTTAAVEVDEGKRSSARSGSETRAARLSGRRAAELGSEAA